MRRRSQPHGAEERGIRDSVSPMPLLRKLAVSPSQGRDRPAIRALPDLFLLRPADSKRESRERRLLRVSFLLFEPLFAQRHRHREPPSRLHAALLQMQPRLPLRQFLFFLPPFPSRARGNAPLSLLCLSKRPPAASPTPRWREFQRALLQFRMSLRDSLQSRDSSGCPKKPRFVPMLLRFRLCPAFTQICSAFPCRCFAFSRGPARCLPRGNGRTSACAGTTPWRSTADSAFPAPSTSPRRPFLPRKSRPAARKRPPTGPGRAFRREGKPAWWEVGKRGIGET